jgi:DNA-binding SARP family transcriptional activator
MEEVPYPLFRVITFGHFSLSRLCSNPQSPEDMPSYEPIAEKVWRSRTAACSLLKLLLCRARRRAPKDLLIEALWPDVPVSNANHNLDTAMSLLRNLLRFGGKESLLTTIHSGAITIYQLPPQPVLWVDVDEFMAQVTLAEQIEEQGGDPLPYFEAAWQIGSDVFLEDELYCQWAQAKSQTVNMTRHHVLYRLADFYVQRNKPHRAEKLLLKALEEEPTNEDALYRLMEVLEQQGRRQEALRIYQRAVDILREEQETVPGARIQELAKHLSTEPPAPSRSPIFSGTAMGIQSVTFFSKPALLTYQPSEISWAGLLEGPHTAYTELVALQQPESEHAGLSLSLKNTISNEVLLYRIIKEICCWTGREDGHEILQANVDRLIRSYDTMEQHNENGESILSRRKVMTLIAGLPAFLLTHEASGQLSTAQIEEFLAQCATSITVCWQLMRGNNFYVVGQMLSKYLPTLETLAYQPSRYQKSSAKLAAQARLLASLIGLHQNDLLKRELHCKHAVTLSQVTQDKNLQVATLMWLAVTYYYSKHPTKALQTYQEALPDINAATPLIQGCLYVRMSNAYAQCGQEQEAVRCLRLAQAVFPEIPENDPSFLFADGGQFTLTLWEGLTRLDLDQPREAWNALAQIERLPSTIIVPERMRLEITNHRAEAAVALGNLELFCDYIEAGVIGAKNLGSERRYNEAFGVYKLAKRLWRNEPRVKELQDLFVRQG